jgi:hypothetical protein
MLLCHDRFRRIRQRPQGLPRRRWRPGRSQRDRDLGDAHGDSSGHTPPSEEPSEQTGLAVGGLSKGIHRTWPGRVLTTGDRVTIAVASARTFDRPTREEPQDPSLREQRERRYYLLLKRRFERPPGRTSAAGRREVNASDTQVLNVDLDIWAESPLDALTHAFGKRVCVLHVGREGRSFSAHVELAIMPRDPERLIRRFVDLVERLPRAARRLWDQARVREFNLGIQAGTSPYSYELRLQPQTLRAMAKVDARFGLTVYAPPPAVSNGIRPRRLARDEHGGEPRTSR